MQTMEQSLADLTQRGVVTLEMALSRSSRPEQLLGLLERAGFDVGDAAATLLEEGPTPLAGGLRVAGA
jgi:hypothetical protein